MATTRTGFKMFKLKYLICHVILQDPMIKGSCDFMEGISSLYVTTLPSLVVRCRVVVEITFSNVHVTSCDHVFKGLCDFMGVSFSW